MSDQARPWVTDEAELSRAIVAAHEAARAFDSIDGPGTAVLHKLAHDIWTALAAWAAVAPLEEGTQR